MCRLCTSLRWIWLLNSVPTGFAQTAWQRRLIARMAVCGPTVESMYGTTYGRCNPNEVNLDLKHLSTTPLRSAPLHLWVSSRSKTFGTAKQITKIATIPGMLVGVASPRSHRTATMERGACSNASSLVLLHTSDAPNVMISWRKSGRLLKANWHCWGTSKRPTKANAMLKPLEECNLRNWRRWDWQNRWSLRLHVLRQLDKEEESLKKNKCNA